ncbi:MAG: 3-oxoadipyl-CoA thiolase [Burkholderiales bacterium]|nr:3-oxoadipyl-CoA thiolase [Burkholderiales bacterium]OUT78746.1 MAG: 3-oxoadipyl-CoA thiolase [Betaproteobacteria bacterium TMED22]|tara:strand:+ start:355 stop:1557 length:1203 start_codon:yes stop_codon:yes gene_type:complete
MKEVFICGGIRTAIGRYGGGLSSVRADDLAAVPIQHLKNSLNKVDWDRLDDVVFGCVNQAGEDNRNIARMATLLSGLSPHIPGSTINRLCGSGLDAVSIAARSIKSAEQQLVMAGGIESMSRAPFVMPKASQAFSRTNEIFDTTLGWRFINPKMEKLYGTDSMPETAENVANQFNVSREDQDRFALLSQEKALNAQVSGRFDREIVPVSIPQRKGEPIVFSKDEHLRQTTLDKLALLSPIVNASGTVTAGNASGVNDGACALILANENAMRANQLAPLARVVGFATAGVEPRLMGIGPVPATQKLLARENVSIENVDVIELNEAFAAQALAVTRELGIEDGDPRVNPNGGAIALGHPLGMSGARLALTAATELSLSKSTYALVTMCIGVGQGIAMLLTRV